jgi:hypothetical protein
VKPGPAGISHSTTTSAENAASMNANAKPSAMVLSVVIAIPSLNRLPNTETGNAQIVIPTETTILCERVDEFPNGVEIPISRPVDSLHSPNASC